MKNVNVIRTVLIIGGIIGIFVGGAQLLMPVTFQASAGIVLGDNVNLLSETRATGGTLLMAGIVIISGAFISGMMYISMVFSTLFYLSYGISRALSMLVDGMPGETLVIATIAEIIIGLISLYLMLRIRNEQQINPAF